MTAAESALRSALADRSYELPPPPEILPFVLRRARAQRRRTVVTVAAAVVAVIVAGAGYAAAIRPKPAPISVRVATGLLDWPTRGPLARDRSLMSAASRIWPARHTHALFLGRVGFGRVAVLEGIAANGVPTIAVVGEHGPGRGELRVVQTGPLIDPHIPVLAFAYDGNLQMPGLVPAWPAAYIQLLVAPTITSVAERLANGPEPAIASRVALLDRDGLSEAWLSVPDGNARGTVQAYVHARLVFEGLVGVNSPVPQPVAALQ
jgi:hypothetical protein